MSEQAATQPPHEYQRFLQSLPGDWDRKEIRQLGTVVGGGTPSRDVPSFWQGRTPWVTPGEVTGNATRLLYDTNERISASGLAGSGANLLPAGSLMVTTRATLGARAINAVPMATNQGFKSIVFRQSADSGFYFHLFEKVQPELVRRASGTTFLEISAAEFAGIEVPSPGPNEKRLITKVLDTLDTAIHETEAIIAKLKAVKQGLLHDLLTRGIDANGELRPSQSEARHLYKESPLGWIPKGWDAASIDDLAESMVDGPFGSNLKTSHYVENPGVRVVRLQNILAGEYDDSERAFVSERHAASLVRNRVQGGDTLIASLGDANFPVGRSCCYPSDLPAAINKADCFRFRSGSRSRNAFVMFSMNGGAARRQVRGFEQGVTMKRINLGNLRRIVIALPSLAEQDQIVERLNIGQQQVDITARQLMKLRHQKLGLMDDLLTGRVRVTPLPAESGHRDIMGSA
jgi:type I restriction enzyme, S subunit